MANICKGRQERQDNESNRGVMIHHTYVRRGISIHFFSEVTSKKWESETGRGTGIGKRPAPSLAYLCKNAK